MKTLIMIFCMLSTIAFSQSYKLADDVKNSSNVVYGHVIYIDQAGVVYVAPNIYKVNRMRWGGNRYDRVETANLYCQNFVYGGFDDWFLPNITVVTNMRNMFMEHHELMLWYDNRDGQPYWSSTNTIYAAYGVFIYKWQGGMFDKEMSIFNVLPVRKFMP